MINIAHRSFLDILDSWVGYNFITCKDIPFEDNVCIQALLPSLSSDMSPIKMTFFLNTFEKKILKSTKKDDNKFYEIDLDKKNFNSIHDFCQEEASPVYYIIAIAKDSIFELTNKNPIDRFDLFIVDLKQAFSYSSKKYIGNTLLIPSHNTLNLALFSLIWASQWVVNFFLPLYSREIINIPQLHQEIKDIFFTQLAGNMKDLIEKQKKFLSNELPKYKNELTNNLYKKLFLRVSLGVALNDVNKTLHTSGEIDKIINYCPESLYGTTNFWLFSAIYHKYMLTSAKKATNNVRIFPFDVNARSTIPQILRASLYLASEYYRTLNVEVCIIKKPVDDENPGDDRNYYGDDIGQVPWLSISDDNCEIDYQKISQGDITANYDFLISRLENDDHILISTLDNKITALQHLGFINTDQLALQREVPLFLFPAEDHIITYPSKLWNYNTFN